MRNMAREAAARGVLNIDVLPRGARVPVPVHSIVPVKRRPAVIVIEAFRVNSWRS
jgi:hypothetical protein